MSKIIIVGAGPMGCYTAQLLRKSGYQPILLEEHISVGKPIQCAGIVSTKLISLVQNSVSKDSIINQINEFFIQASRIGTFEISIPKIASIIDREKFDASLGKDLDIRLGQTVSRIEKDENAYVIHTNQEKIFTADILIGADGPDSIVRNFLLSQYDKDNHNHSFKLNYYFGMQYQIRLNDDNQMFSKDRVNVFFTDDIPFFIWVIPENNQVLRIGVISKHNKKILDRFISEEKIHGEIIDVITGKIPIGWIPTSYQNIALVGDAACQIKPLTGGGLSYGLQSAQILVDCINRGEIGQYDQRWKNLFGKEIRFGLKAREIYESLNREQRDRVFHLFKKNAHFIEQMIDFDHHSTLFLEAFKNPQVLLDAGKLLGYYLRDMLK